MADGEEDEQEAHESQSRTQKAEDQEPTQQAKDALKNVSGKATFSHGFSWFSMMFMRKLTNHGESLLLILLWWIGVIVVSAVLYPFPFVGGFASSTPSGETSPSVTYSMAAWEGVDLFSAEAVRVLLSGVPIFLESLYFSIITFTTIGYGDLYPTGTGSKILIGVESLAGAILIALFIYVLGRQVSR